MFKLPSTLGLHRFGRFACTSLYGGGASELESKPMPPFPINLQVVNVTTNSVDLSWKQPLASAREQRYSQVTKCYTQHFSKPFYRIVSCFRPGFGYCELLHKCVCVCVCIGNIFQLKIDAYKIEMRTKKDRWWRPVGVVSVAQVNSVTPYRIDHLEPNEEYQVTHFLAADTLSSCSGHMLFAFLSVSVRNFQFRVKSRSGKEYGHPSRSTSWFKTLASPPLQPVKQIWWKKLNSHQISIRWDPTELVRDSFR